MTALRLALLVVAVPALVWGGVLLSADDCPARPVARGAGDPSPVATPVDLPAAQVLRAWDERRAAAYAAGSPGRLAELYVAGSRAGASDVRILRDYRARGWRVTGMRMQVVALRVLARHRERLRIEVTDRLHRAVAVAPGRRVVLPRDRSSTRRITLVRSEDDVWRVAAVGPVS